jgi:hypothetical protein
MRVQPLIAVRDAAATSRWYQTLLRCESGHGGSEYEWLVKDGELILQLHALGPMTITTSATPMRRRIATACSSGSRPTRSRQRWRGGARWPLTSSGNRSRTPMPGTSSAGCG